MYNYIYAFFLTFFVLPFWLNITWKLTKSLFKKSPSKKHKDDILIGYKGKTVWDEGLIYAPYVPIINSTYHDYIDEQIVRSEGIRLKNKYKNKKMIKFPLLK